MEDILDVYQRSYSSDTPLFCMDETNKQLVKEVRVPIEMKPGMPTRYDTEYERNGVSNLFIFFEPLTGKRYIEVTESRTAKDWALQIKKLVDDICPNAKRITLVMDNLNTHCGASLYKTFSPKEAKRILDRLDIHYTPKHGSWLNMAEIEFSILSRQCLDCRIPDQASLETAVKVWEKNRNENSKSVKWRFTAEDARKKLKYLYPQIEA